MTQLLLTTSTSAYPRDFEYRVEILERLCSNAQRPSTHPASALSCLLLSGCKFGGMSGSGTDSIQSTGGTGTTGNDGGTTGGGGLGTTGTPPQPTGNAVIATPSVEGTVSVTVGSNQTISISFTTDDGRAVTGFAISDTTLPEGWSGPDAFTCTSAGSGNECVLNLTYAPSAAESGTLQLNFIYVDSAGIRQTPGGSLSIPYVATAFDNVVANIPRPARSTRALAAAANRCS